MDLFFKTRPGVLEERSMKRAHIALIGLGVVIGLASAPLPAQTCAPPWSAATIYASPGNVVSENQTNFKNNWWTQGDDPATHSGGQNSGQPWTALGFCSNTADFTFAASPSSQTAAAGGTASYTVNVSALNGLKGVVSL